MLRFASLLVPLCLAGCGEAVNDNHFADDIRVERPISGPVTSEAIPVRIGELGPNFPACNAVGVTRHLAPGQSLAVRAAPFDTAEQSAEVPVGGRFAICSRSHDQKWFGIVFAKPGSSGDCGVSGPITARRAYDGPCGSGWVSSAFVKMVAGAPASAQSADSSLEDRS